MINVCALSGRIASDPEMRYTTSGMAVVNFRLAVDRGRRDDAGERQTDFLDIVAFGKTAELVTQYLDKGALIGVEGRIQARQWQTPEGQPRKAVEIVANQVHFLESKQEADRRRAARGAGAPSAVRPEVAPAPATAADEDYPPVNDFEDPFGDP